MSNSSRAIHVGTRTGLVLLAATAAGLIAFCWPLFVSPADSSGVGHVGDAPFIFAAILPIVIVVAVAAISEGGIDARTVAILGVLTAVGALTRALGAGTSGVELVFFILVLGGRAFGPGFGFVLGSTTIFASALLTAGVGPWLPFQMLAASWVGAGAGLLPRRTGRAEILLLAVYGFVMALVFGLLMNLWFWPYLTPAGTAISFLPGAPVLENVRRVVVFTVVTSAGWDVLRAVTTTVLLVVLGPQLLGLLRRMVPPVTFTSSIHKTDTSRTGVVAWQSPSSPTSGQRR